LTLLNSDENDELVAQILDGLRQRGETLSTAESITAGSISSTLVRISGASDVFVGGLTAYSDEVKISHLKVDPQLIKKYSAISEQVVEAMAHGAIQTFGTTWAIATTGVAGPGPVGGQEAGTVWVCIVGPINQTTQLELSGERETVRNAATSSAIATFARILSTQVEILAKAKKVDKKKVSKKLVKSIVKDGQLKGVGNGSST
jgi:nicotinamide-nucleotide amidase